MRLYRNIVPSAGLGIVPDLHQLTRRRIDEAFASFLPRTTRCDRCPVAYALEEDRRQHDGAVHEQVHDQPCYDPGEREGDRAEDGQRAIDEDRLSQHRLSSSAARRPPPCRRPRSPTGASPHASGAVRAIRAFETWLSGHIAIWTMRSMACRRASSSSSVYSTISPPPIDRSVATMLPPSPRLRTTSPKTCPFISTIRCPVTSSVVTTIICTLLS